MNSVLVNILNFNGVKYLKPCIDSVLRQTYRNLKIYIMDNYSQDGSVDFIKKYYPDLELSINKSNYGYSKAHNQVIRRYRTDYFLPLNVDVILEPNFIEAEVKAMERDEKIGIVGGCLYQMNKDCSIPKDKLIDSRGIVILKNRRNIDRDYGKQVIAEEAEEYIFGASGAALLLRREMLDDIKIGNDYFDEDFFMYRDEIDLCWRAQLLGWKCIYTPKAAAYHVRSYSPKTKNNTPRFFRYLQFRNRYLLLIKNDFFLNYLRDLPHILLFEIQALLYAIFLKPFLLKSYVGFVKLLPKMLRKRRMIMQKTITTKEYIHQWFK